MLSSVCFVAGRSHVRFLQNVLTSYRQAYAPLFRTHKHRAYTRFLVPYTSPLLLSKQRIHCAMSCSILWVRQYSRKRLDASSTPSFKHKALSLASRWTTIPRRDHQFRSNTRICGNQLFLSYQNAPWTGCIDSFSLLVVASSL